MFQPTTKMTQPDTKDVQLILLQHGPERIGCFGRWIGTKSPISKSYILLMEEILHHLGCLKPCK